MSEHGKRPPGSPRAPIVERARWFQLSEAASIGLEMAAAVGIGAGLGMYVERHWTHWSPWTTFIGLGIGLAAAVLAVIRTARNFSRVIAAEEAVEAVEAARLAASAPPPPTSMAADLAAHPRDEQGEQDAAHLARRFDGDRP